MTGPGKRCPACATARMAGLCTAPTTMLTTGALRSSRCDRGLSRQGISASCRDNERGVATGVGHDKARQAMPSVRDCTYSKLTHYAHGNAHYRCTVLKQVQQKTVATDHSCCSVAIEISLSRQNLSIAKKKKKKFQNFDPRELGRHSCASVSIMDAIGYPSLEDNKYNKLEKPPIRVIFLRHPYFAIP